MNTSEINTTASEHDNRAAGGDRGEQHFHGQLFEKRGTTMQDHQSMNIGNLRKFACRLSASTLAAGLVFGAISPALATIDNTATVSGTAPDSSAVNATSNTVNVPVAPASRGLSISKTVQAVATTAAGTNSAATDGGDTIVYRYTVQNTGNVTETNIVVNDAGPAFDGTAGTGSLGAVAEIAGGSGTAASLAPGETVIFEATYTLSDADAFRGAGAVDPSTSVVNSATADSDAYTMPGGSADTATTGIVPVPSLSVVKTYVLDDTSGTVANAAEVGETITYTYTVVNDGNVPVTGVSIADTHEGSLVAATIGNETITAEGPVANSDIGTADDGVIATLEAGATATFTYVHTVNQTEFDSQ